MGEDLHQAPEANCLQLTCSIGCQKQGVFSVVVDKLLQARSRTEDAALCGRGRDQHLALSSYVPGIILKALGLRWRVLSC